MKMKEENNENLWRVGCKKLANISKEGSFWTVNNLRNFSYPEKDENSPEEDWLKMGLQLHDISEVFLYTVPFLARGIAHVMIGFKIRGRIIVASPELRYRSGQKFSIRTAFGRNRLCYVWGTDDDLIYVRQHVRTGESVFTTKLNLSRKRRIQLFKGLVKRTNMVNHNKFEKYNAILNSCSRNVIHHLEQAGVSFRPTQKIYYTLFPTGISRGAVYLIKKMKEKIVEAKVKNKLRKRKKRRSLSRA